jgi:hypothetical protein
MGTVSVFALALVVLGCGDDGSGGPMDGGRPDGGSDSGPDGPDGYVDAGPADGTAPEFRDVAAMLGDPQPGTLDLASSDAERILAGAVPLTFRVFVRDDETDTEELSVELVSAETEEPVAEQSAQLENGLWRLETTAKPGMSVTVRATDAAGNAAVWPHAAVFPTRAEALERSWTVLQFDGEGTVVSRRESVWSDGRWCTEGDGSSIDPKGGSYSVDSQGFLRVERRHRMACDLSDYGSEWDTVEHTRTTDFYVDGTYFSAAPLTRQGSGTGVQGTWTRTVTVDDGSGPTAATEELMLAQDGSLRWQLADGTVEEGTYEVREVGGYDDNFGDLLVETISRVDGSEMEPQTRVRFYVIRQQKLLVDPKVDVQ